jgi:Tat protein secretion system quality control protein TatD with DNase activity
LNAHQKNKVLQEEQAEQGVMHCFSEDWDTAKAALDLGFYISFSMHPHRRINLRVFLRQRKHILEML